MTFAHLYLLSFSLFLVACQSPVLVRTVDSRWSTMTHDLSPYKVLVVGYAYDAQIRVRFEDSMVAALNQKGIDAMVSYSMYPEIAQINSSTLGHYLSASTDSAVLFTQALGVSKQEYATAETAKAMSGINLFDAAHGDWRVELSATVQTNLLVHGEAAAIWRLTQKMKMEASASPVEILVGAMIVEMDL